MTTPSSPWHWANDITMILNAVYGSGPDRFPVKISKVAKEISHKKYPDDPIIFVEGDRLPGFDGALVHPVEGWGIIYNNSIDSQGRINFTLAHEFGHYLLHRKDYPEGLECKPEDMIRSDSEYNRIEREANIFATNILMPLDDFRKQIHAKEKPTIDKICGCAERYQTSLIATTLRWLEYTERRSLLVVSREDYILWSRSSDSAFNTGLYFKTTDSPPVSIPDASLAAKMTPALLNCKNETTRHNTKVWLSEPCDEITLTSDRYDFVFSLLHFDDAHPYMELEEEPELDTFDKISKMTLGS